MCGPDLRPCSCGFVDFLRMGFRKAFRTPGVEVGGGEPGFQGPALRALGRGGCRETFVQPLPVVVETPFDRKENRGLFSFFSRS